MRSAAPGHNVIRYLMLRMYNQVIKAQYNREECGGLSGLNLLYGCIPFDQMPFCTSLPGHNPRYWDLVESLDATDRNHELLARRVRNNVERHGILYTPVADLEEFGDVTKLIAIYNGKLYYKHTERQLVQDKGHVFIRGYEDDTVAIVEKLQEYASSGIDGYTAAVERWLDEAPRGIDDEVKKDALKLLFSQSKVALIYGAAGTGKSTMVDHIANYFNDKSKLFLAHTNPAIDNLKRRVTAQDSTFRTISSQIYRTASDPEYDLLVIDECSTVSNADLLKVLEKTSFKLLVLVGDVYQIESIQFGNWFGIIRSFIPSTSVFELTTPFRTKSESLLGFWDKVRNIDDDIAEVIARNGYSTVLDKSLFEAQRQDEIILCLNYDGLYGINNVNRFLQSSNPNPAITWGVSTYKVGDPVLFNETERFRPVIYNNLKGRIVGIAFDTGEIQFDVELDRPLTEFDVGGESWSGWRARPYASPSTTTTPATRTTTRLTPLCRSRSPTPSRSTRRRASSTTPSRSSSPTPTRTTSRTASSTQQSPGRGRASRSSGHQRPSRLCSRVFSGVRVQKTSRFCRPAVASRPLPDPGALRKPRSTQPGYEIQRSR